MCSEAGVTVTRVGSRRGERVLAQIEIENYALFKKTRIVFGPGLNVLSGESGAGKSLALEALAAVFGGRLLQERVGPFSDQVRLRAVVHLAPEDPRWRPLADLGLEPDSILIVERQTGRDGRSTYRMQGQPVPAQVVRAFGENLLEYVGQNQLSKVFGRNDLLDWLDGYADLYDMAAQVQQAYEIFSECDRTLRELQELTHSEPELADQRRILDELSALNLVADEEVRIGQELQRLRAGRTLVETGETLYQELDGSANQGGLLAALDGAVRLAETLNRYDSAVGNSVQALGDALKAVGEARLEIGAWLQQLDLNPQRLEQLEARADVLSRVKRRFGPELADVIGFRTSLAREIARLENLEWEVMQATRRRDEAWESLSQRAKVLSGARQAAIEWASRDLTAAIREMEMPTGTILFDHKVDAMTERGCDVLDVIFSASQGQALKSLVKVASGGEVARVALAMAVVGRARNDVVFIFDEVDQGLGGTSADRVGLMLRRLGDEGQVLSVSHQAVVAARAYQHFRVAKVVEDGHSVSTVTRVENQMRVGEIARMLSGSTDHTALIHAQALLNEGERDGG